MEDIYHYFPKQVTVDATEKHVRKFIEENMDAFLDFMFKSNQFTLNEFIDDNEEYFEEFILSGGCGA